MKYILILMMLPSLAFGQSITAAPDTISVGDSFTVTGGAFGTGGPDVVLFDSFQRGEHGDEVTLSSDVGLWNSRNNENRPQYISDDVSGSTNIAGRLVIAGVHQQLRVQFDPVQEYFLSYRLKIPDGRTFPSATSEETFAAISAWKVTWIMDSEDGYLGNDDYCLPTWPNGVYWSLAGNDVASQTSIGTPGTDSQWFEWDNWNRVSVYMKGGLPDPVRDSGIIWAQGMSEFYGQNITYRNNTPVFDGDDSPDCCFGFEDDAVSQWARIYFPGWTRGGSNAEAWYDDIYIATGDNARARVEIGDNATYANCKKLDISTPTSWSNGSVTATARISSFSEYEDAYLFIIDANGNASAGHSIVVGPTGSLGPPTGATLYEGPRR